MNDKELRQLADEFDGTDHSDSIERSRPMDAPDVTPTVVISMRLPKPVLDTVRRQARERGTTATRLMREWIAEHARERSA